MSEEKGKVKANKKTVYEQKQEFSKENILQSFIIHFRDLFIKLGFEIESINKTSFCSIRFE